MEYKELFWCYMYAQIYIYSWALLTQHWKVTHPLQRYWSGASEKGTYGFYHIIQANDVDDVIYYVTFWNIKYAVQK